MKNPRFFYEAESFPAKKAKLLQKAFPHLKLADAQEVTAKALGYSSWFECKKTGLQDKSGPFDQSLDLETLIERQFQQALCLMKIGICSADADKWVRGWGLTGDATLEFKDAIPRYTYWDSLLTSFENGEIDDEAMDALFPGDYLVSNTLIPGYYVDGKVRKRPARVCEGVILGPVPEFENSKLWAASQVQSLPLTPIKTMACYAFSYQAMENFPKYFTGNSSIFSLYDGNYLIKNYLINNKSIEINYEYIVEDHYYSDENIIDNGIYDLKNKQLLKDLIQFVKSHPNNNYIISNHFPIINGVVDRGLRNIAAINGNDFLNLLEKRDVDLNRVIWFENIATSKFIDLNSDSEYLNDLFKVISGFLFDNTKGYKPSQRIISNPFCSDALIPEGLYENINKDKFIRLGHPITNANSIKYSKNENIYGKALLIAIHVYSEYMDKITNDLGNFVISNSGLLGEAEAIKNNLKEENINYYIKSN